jgi:ribosome-binding factor A
MTRRGFRRVQRVAPEIRRLVGEYVLSRLDDPRLTAVVITDVRVSGDLQHARVFFHGLASGANRDEMAAALAAASGAIKRHIGQSLRLRHVPELHFEYDEVIDQARRIEAVLDELREDAPGGADDAGEGGA